MFVMIKKIANKGLKRGLSLCLIPFLVGGVWEAKNYMMSII